MANRKSWRRAAAPPSSRGPSRLAQKGASAPFAGISSAALSTVMHVLLAKDVTLTTVDGAVHTGLFAGTESSPPHGTRFVLNYVRSRPAKDAANAKPLGSFVERRGDVARKFSVNVRDVLSLTASAAMAAVGKADVGTVPAGVKGAFATDGQITRGSAGVGRQLKPFDDFSDLRNDDGVVATPATLDERTFGELANGRPGKKWDQFQVNEDKFGVKTSFDEDEYTTKIDTKDAKFAEREREAARLASEIENGQSDNIHVRIERNQQLPTDYDEETLHSGVQRALKKEPERPAAKPAEPAKATKPAPAKSGPVERPKLSYAAAAAGSVKAQMAQTAQKAAITPGAKPGAAAGRASPAVPAKAVAVGTSSSANKERDVVVEKKPKSNGPRASRENLPQLVKVRSTITGRNSPSQSRNSPLPTPATADTSAVKVLNLDAQTPKFGPEHIKSFEEYKTNREIRSIAENREKITDDLKKFSTQLDSRNGPLRRSSSNANGSVSINSGTTGEKKASESSAKTDGKAASAKPVEAKAEQDKEAQPAPTKAPEAAPKARPKLKSKLNPNAAEFKFNPDAPTFEPTAQKQQASMNAPPQTFSPYPVGGVPPEYTQPAQPGHQGYPVPMQAMGQIPYGQYGMIMPGAVPSGMAGGNSAYQFMQGPPGAFPGAQVPGRFQQSAGMPVSFGYPQMNPTVPVVMTQTPQRIPTGPYPYYSSGPYPGGQVPGGPQLPQPPQQMYTPTNPQPGVPHMQGGGMHVGNRGAHGHSRRGGGGRRGGKHHGQHTHTISTNGQMNGNADKGVPRPTENGELNSQR